MVSFMEKLISVSLDKSLFYSLTQGIPTSPKQSYIFLFPNVRAATADSVSLDDDLVYFTSISLVTFCHGCLVTI
jgi:hypothetical protein